jgi:hypothetical protein
MVNSLDTRRPRMLPAHSRPRHHHLPRNARASGSASSTSLVCQIEPEVDVHGRFDTAHTSSIDVGQPPTKGITSQCCTAMSFDTRNAIARFIGWFWQDTRERVCVPPGFSKPLPRTHQNPYPWGGYGFSRVRVRVALGYPRVTHDNH